MPGKKATKRKKRVYKAPNIPKTGRSKAIGTGVSKAAVGQTRPASKGASRSAKYGRRMARKVLGDLKL